MSDLIPNYLFLLWFKALRPVKKKYKLRINYIMMLNGCYLYQKHVGTAFSQSSILKFVSYYDCYFIKKMIDYLCGEGFIYIAETLQRNNLYKLTEKGIKVVEEINDGYIICLQKFTEEYKIIL
jgi:hypothetical protein